MKMLNKMLLSFVSIVLIFGFIIALAASFDSERELKNLNSLYEERGVSIAKTIDASIMSDVQLHNDSQTIVDRLIESNLGVAVINIHGKAPEGIKIPGYWKGYWILASSNKSNIHLPSNAIDLSVMKTNKYSVASYNENGKTIIDVIYPLHDPSGIAIAIAEIVFDMSPIQSQMLKRNTNIMQIALILTLLAIIATIFKHKVNIDNLENLIKERTSKLEAAFKSLKESEKSLAEAQRIAHIGSWEWEIATDKAHCSDELYRIFGLSPQVLAPNYTELLGHIHPEDRDYIINVTKKAINGKPFSIDFRIIQVNGEERTVHMQSEVVYNNKNIPVKKRGTLQDITERKKSEEKIRSLANIVESSSDAIITLSLEGIVTSWNKGAEQIYGYSQNEILGKSVSLLAPSNLVDETKGIIERIKQKYNINNYETLRLRKDGKIIDVSLTFSPVYDLYGKITGISVIGRDITKRVEAEKAIAEIEIARKQEIHHRIKNNLQVISSLLDLQAEKFKKLEYIKYSDVLESFKESQDRVISMALIHEELYKGGGSKTLNFSQYVKELSENLLQTYKVGNKGISLKLTLAENIFFDMDIAVPLGIIVNELVTNSLKHAFQGRDNGEIQIKLQREELRSNLKNVNGNFKGMTFELTVSDNGVGIPENFDIELLDSLGLQLVTSLVDQLDGELEIKRKNGTEFTIWFTINEKNDQHHQVRKQNLCSTGKENIKFL